jgi:hypothetical protein
MKTEHPVQEIVVSPFPIRQVRGELKFLYYER